MQSTVCSCHLLLHLPHRSAGFLLLANKHGSYRCHLAVFRQARGAGGDESDRPFRKKVMNLVGIFGRAFFCPLLDCWKAHRFQTQVRLLARLGHKQAILVVCVTAEHTRLSKPNCQ